MVKKCAVTTNCKKSAKGYWAVAGSGIQTHTITNKRLAQAGYYSILDRYESLH